MKYEPGLKVTDSTGHTDYYTVVEINWMLRALYGDVDPSDVSDELDTWTLDGLEFTMVKVGPTRQALSITRDGAVEVVVRANETTHFIATLQLFQSPAINDPVID